MPVFDAPDSEHTTIHHPLWDPDETVTVRRVTYSMEKRAQGKAVRLPEHLDTAQLRAMPEQDVERLLMEHTDPAAVDLEVMRQCIVSWTLRRAPSREQREKGERGAVMPLTPEAIAALPPDAGDFIRSEIEKLRDTVQPAELLGPQGDDFRGADAVPGGGRLSGPGGHSGKADAARGSVGGENGLDAGPDRRRAARTA